MKKTDFKFYYKEVNPTTDLEHLIFGFFEFVVKSDSPKPIPLEVFPDGCVSILFRRNKKLGLEMFLLKGLSLETFHTEVFAGDIHWGVKLSPAACAEILQCDPQKVPTQPVFNDNLLPHLLKGVSERLSKCENFKEAIEIYKDKMKELNIDREDIDAEVAQAVEIIEAEKGEIKIGNLAENLKIGRRQLERRFRKCTGTSPKQFARTYRLRATAINMLEKDMNWANRAAEMGFTDQSHLSHELENLTGRSPKDFRARLDDIDYKDLIK